MPLQLPNIKQPDFSNKTTTKVNEIKNDSGTGNVPNKPAKATYNRFNTRNEMNDSGTGKTINKVPTKGPTEKKLQEVKERVEANRIANSNNRTNAGTEIMEFPTKTTPAKGPTEKKLQEVQARFDQRMSNINPILRNLGNLNYNDVKKLLDDNKNLKLLQNELSTELSAKEIEELQNEINTSVNLAGKGTRAGTAAAAVALITGLGKRGISLPYYYTGGHYDGTVPGVNSEWGKTVASQGKNVYRDKWSLDCSGFVWWAMSTAGINDVVHVATGSNGYEGLGEETSFSDAKTGDLIVNTKFREEHVILVVDSYEDEFGEKHLLCAESTGGGNGSKSGVVLNEYTQSITDNSYIKVINMDNYYEKYGTQESNSSNNQVSSHSSPFKAYNTRTEMTDSGTGRLTQTNRPNATQNSFNTRTEMTDSSTGRLTQANRPNATQNSFNTRTEMPDNSKNRITNIKGPTAEKLIEVENRYNNSKKDNNDIYKINDLKYDKMTHQSQPINRNTYGELDMSTYPVGMSHEDQIARATLVSKYLMKNGGFTAEQAAAMAGVFVDENGCVPGNVMEAEKNGKGVPGTGGNGYGAGIGAWTFGDFKERCLADAGYPAGTRIEDLTLQQQCDLIIAMSQSTNWQSGSNMKTYYDALKRCNNIEDASATAQIITGGVGKSSNWGTHPTVDEAKAMADWYAYSNDNTYGYSDYHHGMYERRLGYSEEIYNNLVNDSTSVGENANNGFSTTHYEEN